MREKALREGPNPGASPSVWAALRTPAVPSSARGATAAAAGRSAVRSCCAPLAASPASTCARGTETEGAGSLLYGGLPAFFNGLEPRIGSPDPKV